MGDRQEAATTMYKRQNRCADASEASSSRDEESDESEDDAQLLFKPQERSIEESDDSADESSWVSLESGSADAEPLMPLVTSVGEFFSVLKRRTLSSIHY
jgi:hypothetical protein